MKQLIEQDFSKYHFKVEKINSPASCLEEKLL